MLESIETINYRLERNYGKFGDGRPIWRVIFSDDEFEWRRGTFTKTDVHGNYLGEETKTERVPKYRQWVHGKYILERIVPMPVVRDLVEKTSYEPVWVFEDANHNALPPKWEAILLIMHSINEQAARAVGAKYTDPNIAESGEEHKDKERKRIATLYNDLFGNETLVGDALAHKHGIVVPGGNNEHESSVGNPKPNAPESTH